MSCTSFVHENLTTVIAIHCNQTMLSYGIDSR